MADQHSYHHTHSDAVVRKTEFLAAHPEWGIVYVHSTPGYHQASRDMPITVMTDYDLGKLMDKLDRLVKDEA